MSDTSATLGERLKAGREQKGFTTQKVADELHLDPWVIDALESGDFVRIGPAVYGKGHLKRYAALLGLPADEVLQLYDSRTPAAAAAAPAASLRMPAEEPVAGGRGVAAWVVGAAVALIVALFVLWRPWQPRVGPEPRVAAASAGEFEQTEAAAKPDLGGETNLAGMPAMAVPPAVAVRPAVTVRPETLPKAALAPPPSAMEHHGGLGRARLKLSFSADSWVDIRDADGRRLFAGHGRANSVKTLAGAAPLSVYLGFASGVQLEVNHRAVAIGPQFVAGDEARFAAGADGVLRRDAHPAATAANPHPRG